jgi:hypothetical protein
MDKFQLKRNMLSRKLDKFVLAYEEFAKEAQEKDYIVIRKHCQTLKHISTEIYGLEPKKVAKDKK